MAEKDECRITKDEKSRIKETIINTEPRITKKMTGRWITHCSGLCSKYYIMDERMIIVSETRTGARTGPVQITGIRNSISQVSHEEGQSNMSLRKT